MNASSGVWLVGFEKEKRNSKDCIASGKCMKYKSFQ